MHDITSLRSVCFGEINPRNLRPNQVQRETGSLFCAQVPGLAQGWQGTLSTSSTARAELCTVHPVHALIRQICETPFKVSHLTGIFVINLDDCYRSQGP